QVDDVRDEHAGEDPHGGEALTGAEELHQEVLRFGHRPLLFPVRGVTTSRSGQPGRVVRLPSFFRNPETGRVVVAQWPNLPLWIFIAATAVRLLLSPDGGAGTAVTVVASVALGVWSVLEIWKGESPFRRVLGAVVLVAMIVGRVAG